MNKFFNIIAFYSVAFLCAFSASADSAELKDPKFETILVPSEIASPKNGEIVSVLFALKITNPNDVAIVINKYQTPIPVVESNSGEILQTVVQSDVLIAAEKGDYGMLKAKHTTYIIVDTSIKRQDGNLVMYGTSKDGSEWSVNLTGHESCKISLKYKPDQLSVPKSTLRPWIGEVISKSRVILVGN